MWNAGRIEVSSAHLINFTPQSFTNNNSSKDTSLQVTSNWADNILDTAQLRRGRNIVVCLFEVIVGSKDSTRASKKWDDGTTAENQRSHSFPPETDYHFVEDQYYSANDYYNEQYGSDSWADDHLQWSENQIPVAHFVPPPEPEEEVDEKTRLRRHEVLLLPSRPPDGAGSSSTGGGLAPTAPFIPEDEGLYQSAGTHGNEGGVYVERNIPSATSARSVDTIVPSYSPSHSPRVEGNSFDPSQDDKQDLERQRLMAAASAPLANECEAAAGPSTMMDAPIAPTAPTLSEEDEYNAHTLTHDHEADDNLPRYRR